MSIENQATFYLRNVCNYDPSIKSDTALTEQLVAGFAEFSALLRTIYADFHSYEISTVSSEITKIGIMTDDLENYHNLTYTLDCLYAIAESGELYGNDTLCVNKSLFKTGYKKSIAFPFEMLGKYGFYFTYYKADNEVSDYKRCDLFDAHYENDENLLSATKFITEQLAKHEKKKEMVMKVAFMLADYHFILTASVNQNPLQQNILDTLGELSARWEELVSTADNCGFTTDMSFQPYVFPYRTITLKHNKKNICKFEINVNRLHIRFQLPFEIAKDLVSKRSTLPQSINQNIDSFGCANCGKCENKINITSCQGADLCSLPYSNFITEDSRCLRFDVTTKQEVQTLCEIFKQISQANIKA